MLADAGYGTDTSFRAELTKLEMAYVVGIQSTTTVWRPGEQPKPAPARKGRNGRPRKLVATGARNGYFFTVDRLTGEPVASGKFSAPANWASGLDKQGRPILNPEKVATIPGAIVSSSATNWPPPAYSPDTGLFYLPENNQLSIHYLIDEDPRGSMGLGGTQGGGGVSTGGSVTAVDPVTAKVAWRHALPGGGGATGMLTTAGRLVFAGDGAGNIVASALWSGMLR